MHEDRHTAYSCTDRHKHTQTHALKGRKGVNGIRSGVPPRRSQCLKPSPRCSAEGQTLPQLHHHPVPERYAIQNMTSATPTPPNTRYHGRLKPCFVFLLLWHLPGPWPGGRPGGRGRGPVLNPATTSTTRPAPLDPASSYRRPLIP